MAVTIAVNQGDDNSESRSMVVRLTLAALLFPAALLLAHHSAAAEFDTSKPAD